MSRNQNLLLGGIIGVLLVVGVAMVVQGTILVGPEKVGEYYMEAFAENDAITAVGLTCAPQQQALKQQIAAQGGIERMLHPNPLAVNSGVQVDMNGDGKSATVTFGQAIKYSMVKEGNLWRVCPS